MGNQKKKTCGQKDTWGLYPSSTGWKGLRPLEMKEEERSEVRKISSQKEICKVMAKDQSKVGYKRY